MARRLLEKTCEDAVVAAANLLGVPSLKLNLKGNGGWPDREFLIPGGRPLWIEFKSPGFTPDPRQGARHETLTILGYDVETHTDREAALRSIRRAMEAGQRSAQGRAVPAGTRLRRAAGRSGSR